ncbi:glutamine-hydrolyzing carbamoyl-phosphate synthase small subunit [Chitinispirillales bacterium ANBcel5]|uniref:glutamine-hydrolyzing carbamoyl-phosphate synthase small subunit n=1 Tax=Cellulosispirillum alkaliphilum TaxID=3039283 RepID=UPI002A505ADA|nr:glutamine-hydrolyzing carbamoyl-phosphate synthase small subunit [Chitinispirillales bacterium ANBcel5]
MKGYIALEDGTVFEGESFGAAGEAVGEVVFNTSLSGYQEVLTDPSYSSQIVTMTNPLIGNYGINEDDIESSKIQVSGFVVKEACSYPSNFTSQKSLSEYLRENNVIGIEDIDTRALTRHIREKGALKAVICSCDSEISKEKLVEKAKAWKGLKGTDLVKEVTCSKAYSWDSTEVGEKKYSVVALDFGVKYNILRILSKLGCQVKVVPAHTSAEEILSYNPDGIFLSNGPGDPSAVTYAIDTIKELIGKRPLFGICLGHQLLSLALGGTTYKLKFGHRGSNHPVKNNGNGVVEITSQNHGFCVDTQSLSSSGATLSHTNLNDQTCEGLTWPQKKLFSVQYHPEASPGPHDSGYLFEDFITMMEEQKHAETKQKQVQH